MGWKPVLRSDFLVILLLSCCLLVGLTAYTQCLSYASGSGAACPGGSHGASSNHVCLNMLKTDFSAALITTKCLGTAFQVTPQGRRTHPAIGRVRTGDGRHSVLCLCQLGLLYTYIITQEWYAADFMLYAIICIKETSHLFCMASNIIHDILYIDHTLARAAYHCYVTFNNFSCCIANKAFISSKNMGDMGT